MNIPTNLLFTKEHEWIKIDGETATIGITDYAQHALGDVTFVELPKIGKEVKQFQNLASVESVKAASDIYSPMAGIVTKVNQALENEPSLINTSCYEDGWITKIKIKDINEKKNLMDKTTYAKFLEGLQH
jgi:glycine cleavage system H protein